MRSRLSWSLPAWKRRESRDELVRSLERDARRRFDELDGRFDLCRWPQLCSRIEWLESLYVLDLVATHLPRAPEGRRLDVGSKTAAYLPGLVAALGGAWDLVEVDAHRRYLWGSTRRVYGEAMAAAFEGCRYHAGDVRSLEGPWSAVTWLLPFVHPHALKAWGLPRTMFDPGALLRHVTDRVVRGGSLLVVNQGDIEAAAQRKLFDELELPVRELGRIDSPLSPFTKVRYGFVYTRP